VNLEKSTGKTNSWIFSSKVYYQL